MTNVRVLRVATLAPLALTDWSVSCGAWRYRWSWQVEEITLFFLQNRSSVYFVYMSQ